MVMIPKENPNTTKNKLNSIKWEVDITERRTYLGMSGLNKECMRSLQYGFRWATDPKPMSNRQKRIFERGDIEEARVIRDLKKIGIEVYRILDGKKIELFGHVGEEQEEIIGFAGHVKGHTDGRCINIPESPKTEHLLEIKTANQSKFNTFAKNGVKSTNRAYHGQAQLYMGGLDLKRCLFIVLNKNTEEYYVERIKFDKEFYDDLLRKELELITTESLFRKLDGYKKTMICTYCDHLEVCENISRPAKNCRTCRHVEVHNKGIWKCGLDNNEKALDKLDQIRGCEFYGVAGWL